MTGRLHNGAEEAYDACKSAADTIHDACYAGCDTFDDPDEPDPDAPWWDVGGWVCRGICVPLMQRLSRFVLQPITAHGQVVVLA